MPPSARYRPAPIHLGLGPALFDPVAPARFPEHRLRFRNQRWADRVGLDTLTPAEWETHCARFQPLPANLPEPLALRYHGHQFRSYNPHLGDGRGFLYAQLRDAVDDRVLDLGTKGSGQTPYSRGGDGRLTLKGGVREVLATELLEALGVYTSKSFSLFETGEELVRGDEPSPTRSSVLVRLSHSHIRFGTFQRLAALGETATISTLLAHCLEHYLPEHDRSAAPAVAFLDAVVQRSAALAASWITAGFVHGVLNTDNMNVTGESFDYGPWRFLPALDPEFVAAYFDETGLYAFGQQPTVVWWNLHRLAETLTSQTSSETLQPVLARFEPAFRSALRDRLHTRLGLLPTSDPDEDQAFADAVMTFLGARTVGYDQFFFDWYGGSASATRALGGLAAAAYQDPRFQSLRRRIDARTPAHPERLHHAAFQRLAPPTLVIDEVEALWKPIATDDDWSAFEKKISAIRELGAALAGAA